MLREILIRIIYQLLKRYCIEYRCNQILFDTNPVFISKISDHFHRYRYIENLMATVVRSTYSLFHLKQGKHAKFSDKVTTKI